MEHKNKKETHAEEKEKNLNKQEAERQKSQGDSQENDENKSKDPSTWPGGDQSLEELLKKEKDETSTGIKASSVSSGSSI